MLTVADWCPNDPENDDEEQRAVGIFCERNPEWLATGDLEKDNLCEFVSPHPDGGTLELWCEELTLSWTRWHHHFTFSPDPPEKVVDTVVAHIEAIQNGQLVCVIAYDSEDRWLGGYLLPPQEVFLSRVQRDLSPQTTKIVVTSWVNGTRTISREPIN